MRNAFIEELANAATVDEKIALVVGDLGYGVVEPFSRQFPKRFFNAGVAEQNMMGLSAGLASEGFHVFVYSIANFPTFRCAEQIRNDIDYHNLPVTIVTVGGGLAYGNLGYSHHAIQDYALMRTMPNMMIAAPGDPLEVRACMRFLLDHPQPSYLRLGKAGEINIHTKLPDVYPGRWMEHYRKKNNTSVIITTGATLDIGSRYIQECGNGIYDLYSVPLWGMREKSSQIEMLTKYSEIITIEDHLEDAGFGSWILETSNLLKNSELKIRICGLTSEVCGMVGKQKVLNELGGLDLQKFLIKNAK